MKAVIVSFHPITTSHPRIPAHPQSQEFGSFISSSVVPFPLSLTEPGRHLNRRVASHRFVHLHVGKFGYWAMQILKIFPIDLMTFEPHYLNHPHCFGPMTFLPPHPFFILMRPRLLGGTKSLLLGHANVWYFVDGVVVR